MNKDRLIGDIAQREMLLSFLRQKSAECGDVIAQIPGFDGDTEIALLLNQKKTGSFYIFPQDAGMLKVLFESLAVYYTQKSYGIEAEIAALKRANTVTQNMPI